MRGFLVAVFVLVGGNVWGQVTVDVQGHVTAWYEELNGHQISIDVTVENLSNYQLDTLPVNVDPENWPDPYVLTSIVTAGGGDTLLASALTTENGIKAIETGGCKFAYYLADNYEHMTATLFDLSLDITVVVKKEQAANTVSNPVAGDTNSDGDVDWFDLDTVADNFGNTNASWEDGDFDGDGDVDFSDYLTASTNYQAW